jgi:hypothetical protein
MSKRQRHEDASSGARACATLRPPSSARRCRRTARSRSLT